MNRAIITEKQLDAMAIALNEKCNLLIFEGQIRSSKTVVAIQAFFEAVQMSSEELHLVAANDLDAIRDNILNNNLGILDLYSSYCTLAKDKIGSYYIDVKCDIEGKPKNKRILLSGYADAAKWKKILGKTLGVILVDEVNTSSKQFVDECFARQTSANRPLMIWTLNGDIPTLWVYQDYINTAIIIGSAPASIRAEMDRVKKVKGRYYMHWKMQDNPIMTQEKIDRAMSLYPPGSHYFKIKILGERGSPGRMVFVDYMSDDLIKKQDVRKYTHFGIGVDIGASRAMNAFALVGFTADFSKCAVIDLWSFKQIGYESKKQKLKDFVNLWRGKGVPIEYIAVDNQEINYIYDLKAEFYRTGYPPIIESYKATIIQRIDLQIILLSHKAMEFNDTIEGRDCFDAYRMAKWVEGKEGLEREDKNEPHNDKMDAVEYALTRHMIKMLTANKAGNEVA